MRKLRAMMTVEDLEKERERVRKWQADNPEKARESCKRYRKQNPDKARAAERKWQDKNRDKVRAYARNRRQRNPEKVREKDRRNHHIRQSARKFFMMAAAVEKIRELASETEVTAWQTK